MWAGWSASLVGRHVKFCRRGETEEGTQGPLLRRAGCLWVNYLQAPEFLVTPLLMGPVCLTIQAGLKSQSAPGLGLLAAIIVSLKRLS